jgi:hypothetical protein
MTFSLDLVAIKKNDKYYLRDKNKYPSTFDDESRLRFDVDRCESFSEKWLVFDALPTFAKKCIVGRNLLIGFCLKDGFQITDRTPTVLPSDAFDEDDDYDDSDYFHKNADIRGLYDCEYEKLPDVWETVDLTIQFIDHDCEPLIKTKYKFATDFPHYIDHHGVVRHKYPCTIKAVDVFKYITNAVKDDLPEHCYISSDFDFHFAVDVRIPVLHEETHRVDKSSWNSRKPKWVDTPLREVQKCIINICTPNHGYGDVVVTVSADNYYDLEKKMDDIIQSYLDLLQTKPVMCPYCKGHGWTLADEHADRQI